MKMYYIKVLKQKKKKKKNSLNSKLRIMFLTFLFLFLGLELDSPRFSGQPSFSCALCYCNSLCIYISIHKNNYLSIITMIHLLAKLASEAKHTK